jgi:hypothetical protein
VGKYILYLEEFIFGLTISDPRIFPFKIVEPNFKLFNYFRRIILRRELRDPRPRVNKELPSPGPVSENVLKTHEK